MERKLLFIEAQRLFRKQKHGMDVVAFELLQRLKNADTGFDMTVLVKEDEDQCLQDSSTLKVQTLKGAFYPLWEQWILPRFIALQKNSVLHCTGNTAPVWGKIPLLVTIHDLIFLEQNYLFKKDGGSLYQRFGNVYRSLVVPIVAKRAKHILTVSEYQRQVIIKKLGVLPAKVSVVYNGADERFFEELTPGIIQTIGKKYGIDFPYIFFLANTEPRKNTAYVIKSFILFCEQHPNYKHKLVIKGLSTAQLEKKIAASGGNEFTDRIHHIRYIDYADMPALYQGAAMLWFPSLCEGFGLPIVEAMAGGTPVITSNLGVMPEIAGNAALYINPVIPAELVAQSVVLLNDNALRNRVIEKGRRRAGQFTWNNSIRSLLGVYEKNILPAKLKVPMI
ncbi:MAG: glycosyltransferase family 1 protein [Ferruginibacter sp.]